MQNYLLQQAIISSNSAKEKEHNRNMNPGKHLFMYSVHEDLHINLSYLAFELVLLFPVIFC